MDNAKPEQSQLLTPEIIQHYAQPEEAPLQKLEKGINRFLRHLTREVSNIAEFSPTFSYEGYRREDENEKQDEEDDEKLFDYIQLQKDRSLVRVILDRPVVFGLCEAAFGGTGNERPYEEDRPYSKTERAISGLFFKAFAQSFSSAFDEYENCEFAVRPKLADDDNEDIANFKSEISVRVIFNAFGYSGEIILEISKAISQKFRSSGNKSNISNQKIEWAPKIIQTLENTNIPLIAVLDDIAIPFSRLVDLRPGDLIPLNINIQSTLNVESGGIKIFKARVGKNDEKYCLQIEEKIASPLSQT